MRNGDHDRCADEIFRWIWQQMSPEERQKGMTAISGTRTFLNNPPSANATLEDVIEFGYAAGPSREIGELLSTTSGPFCYVYV